MFDVSIDGVNKEYSLVLKLNMFSHDSRVIVIIYALIYILLNFQGRTRGNYQIFASNVS